MIPGASVVVCALAALVAVPVLVEDVVDVERVLEQSCSEPMQMLAAFAVDRASSRARRVKRWNCILG